MLSDKKQKSLSSYLVTARRSPLFRLLPVRVLRLFSSGLCLALTLRHIPWLRGEVSSWRLVRFALGPLFRRTPRSPHRLDEIRVPFLVCVAIPWLPGVTSNLAGGDTTAAGFLIVIGALALVGIPLGP